MEKIGLKKEDAISRTKWCKAVNKLSRIMRCIQPPLLMETKPN